MTQAVLRLMTLKISCETVLNLLDALLAQLVELLALGRIRATSSDTLEQLNPKIILKHAAHLTEKRLSRERE